MNESRDHAALDAVNDKKTRFFRPSIQNALGAFMVMLVTTSAGVVLFVRDNTRDNTRAIEEHIKTPHASQVVEWKEFDALRDQFTSHSIDGKRKHALIDQAIKHERALSKDLTKFIGTGGHFNKQGLRRLQSQVAELEKRIWSCGCNRQADE